MERLYNEFLLKESVLTDIFFSNALEMLSIISSVISILAI